MVLILVKRSRNEVSKELVTLMSRDPRDFFSCLVIVGKGCGQEGSCGLDLLNCLTVSLLGFSTFCLALSMILCQGCLLCMEMVLCPIHFVGVGEHRMLARLREEEVAQGLLRT